jgi:hypothetical protein
MCASYTCAYHCHFPDTLLFLDAADRHRHRGERVGGEAPETTQPVCRRMNS